MSPRRCAVGECTSISSDAEHRNVIFHSFPPNMRTVWLKNCRLSPTTVIRKGTLVCSRHFRHDTYHPLKNNVYRLRSGAEPTVFSWTIENAASTNVCGSNSSKSDRAAPKMISSSSIKLEKPSPLKQAINTRSAITATGKNRASSNSLEGKSVPKKPRSLRPKPAAIDIVPSLSADDLSKMKLDFVSALAQGMALEAQDFNGLWHHAVIMEVDPNEKEVLVHFEKDAEGKGPT